MRDVQGEHAALGEMQRVDLADVDVVLLRQDPPFDLAYIATTHLLERIHPATLVVNDPRAVRDAPEKLFVMDFPELMPATLISRDRAGIEAFRAEHGEVVMKPLYGDGGAAVLKVGLNDPNFGSLFDLFSVDLPRALGRSRNSCRRSPTATSASSWSTGRRSARSIACRSATTSAPIWCAAAPPGRPN